MYPDGPPLERQRPYNEQWRCPRLVITQACGLDLFVTPAPIRAVSAPVFDLPDCPEGEYFSYLIGRPGRGVAAVNSLSSRSGCTALLAHASPKSFLLTGSHRKSIQAVREDRADFASIDAVTWHLLERHEPDQLDGVTPVDRTASATAPPYVVRNGSNGDVTTRLRSAMSDPATVLARRALLIRGVKPVRRNDYADTKVEYERVRSLIPSERSIYRSYGQHVKVRRF